VAPSSRLTTRRQQGIDVSSERLAFDASSGMPLTALSTLGAPSSSPTVVGDRVVLGIGTRTPDLEPKAFAGGALEPVVGPSPLSPLSTVSSFRVRSR
jgi:hypothetical protein